MPKYRLKNPECEGFEFRADLPRDEWPRFMMDALRADQVRQDRTGRYQLETSRQSVVISDGDFILVDSKGEIAWLCADDFHQSFEPID